MSYYDMATGNQRSDGVMNGATLPPMNVRTAAPTGPGQPRVQPRQVDISQLLAAVRSIGGNPAVQQRPAPGGGFLSSTSPPGGSVGVAPAPYYGSSSGTAIGPTWSGTSPTPSGGPNYNATISPNGKTVSWTNANGQTFTSQRFGY